MEPLNPRQKRLLFGLVPGPALVAGALVMGELSPGLGWGAAAFWALGAAALASGAFVAYFFWNEARRARRPQEPQDPPPRHHR